MPPLTNDEAARSDANVAADKTTAGFQPDPTTGACELPGDRYRVIGEIGRGGMGIVLRVLDTSFNRPLAIKLLRPTQHRAEVAERRFLDEARITGQLQHPGIPPVHEVGRLADGRPFFSMKLIEGRTLAELLAERSGRLPAADPGDVSCVTNEVSTTNRHRPHEPAPASPLPQADLPRFLKIFEQIAQTIAYAHSQSVIHRDLKPLNVMVGTFGEVQVMDWGLAKRLAWMAPVEAANDESPVPPTSGAAAPAPTVLLETDSTDTYTQAGEVLGTFAYMSPEQARGQAQAPSVSWDVFGLGAILCAILTGRPPYVGQGSPDLLRQAKDAELGPAWQRLDDCGADPELVALAKRCLAPRAEDRPRDAGQVAEEIARYLASVQERLQETLVTQARAEVAAREERKRRRLAVGLALAVVVLIVSVSVFGLWYANEQARRDERTHILNREVTAALDESLRLRGDLHTRLVNPQQAAQMQSELHEWESLLDSARAAWVRARTLAHSGHDLVALDLRERLESVDALLQSDESERELAFALDRVRLEASSPVDGQISLVSATPHLAKLFHDAGYSIEEGDLSDIASRIGQSTIRLPLVAGLDFWAVATEDAPLRGRLLEVARRADPHPWRDRFRQPAVWTDEAQLKALAGEVDFNEQSPQVLTALAYRRTSDVGLVRRALVAYPRDFWLLFQLGMNSKNPVEQAGAFRAALAVRPDSSVVYFNLGYMQQAQQQWTEAADCYRRALALAPDSSSASNNLGLVLDELHQPDEAIACYKRATELAPQSITGHINLGAGLHNLGKFDEAIASYRRASDIDPRNTTVLNNLGAALRAKNQFDEAADCYRMAIELNGANAHAWCNLGHILNIQGKFDEALEAMRKGHELGTGQPGWNFPSALWVLQTESRVALDKKLDAVLRGEATPADAQEYAAMAELCVKNRQRYATALRFYTTAFARAPQIADDPLLPHRFHAACAAVLAADGQGADADDVSAEQRLAARRDALAWLRADLQVAAELLDRQPGQSATVASALEQLQTDPALASVRGAAALAKLPSDEQSAWQQLWADIAALRQRAVPRGP